MSWKSGLKDFVTFRYWPFVNYGMWNDDHFHDVRLIVTVILPMAAVIFLIIGH